MTDETAEPEEPEEELRGPQTIKLSDPIKLGDTLYDEITVQEPRARHLRGIPLQTDAMTFGNLLDLAGKLSGVPQKVIDDLSPKDATALIAVVSSFIARFQ